jgi:hypothetical protein
LDAEAEPLDPFTETLMEALVACKELLANPKPLTAAVVMGFRAVLQAEGVTVAELREGLTRLLAAERFFPTPADLLKHCRPDPADAVELAWQAVLRAVRVVGIYGSVAAADLGGDGRALWAVDRMGWERLCTELEPGNRAIYRKEFERLYLAAGGATVEYVAGLHERVNGLQGVAPTRPELVGRPDLAALPAGAPAEGYQERPRLAPPACGECGGRYRHRLTCDHYQGPEKAPAAAGWEPPTLQPGDYRDAKRFAALHEGSRAEAAEAAEEQETP